MGSRSQEQKRQCCTRADRTSTAKGRSVAGVQSSQPLDRRVMEASIEQQLVIGSPPVASEFQPNGLWVVMECPAPAAAPKVWQVHAYAYVPCRIDWGDNTGIVAIPNEYAVSGQAPGLLTGS